MNSSKVALVIGGFGQDGMLLSIYLRISGLFVVQIGSRNISNGNKNWSLNSTVDNSPSSIVKFYKPDFIFFLAAKNSPSDDQGLNQTCEALNSFTSIDVDLLELYFLAVVDHYPQCRVFYSSSCLVFGSPLNSPQNELTPRAPSEPYAVSKSLGEEVVKHYRDHHDIFAVTGILYPHSSSIQRKDFLFPRIVKSAYKASLGIKAELEIADLKAQKDWLFAGDTVKAMWETLHIQSPTDFVIGRGQLNSIQDLCMYAYSYFDLNFENFVIETGSSLVRKNNTKPLVANTEKILKLTQWSPSISFSQLVEKCLVELESGIN